MQFDEAFFSAGLDRTGTDCIKWDVSRREHGGGVLPMWVADMDFPVPPAVSEAVARRAAHPTYGYTEMTDADRDALIGFWRRRHGVSFEREDITLLPCVVSGLRAAVQAFTKPGDGVLLFSPVYGPFFRSVEGSGRRVMDAPLVRREDGRWDMDLGAVEARCREGAKLCLLCSPHNPVSRLWRREELQALLDLLARYGVPVVSDEIHADFVYAPGRFVSCLSLRREGVMTLCAPSKTFNLAGLQSATAISSDAQMRSAFRRVVEENGIESGNIFGLTAARAAYTEGDAWLDGLLAYLAGNRDALAAALADRLPSVRLTPMEATYLGWMDCRAAGLPQAELERRTLAAGVQFTSGTFFGAAGEGYLRINLGCPRRNVLEAVERLKKAIG